MKCHHCGSELSDNAKFCGKCGAEVQGHYAESSLQNEPVKKKRHHKKVLLLILTGAVILGGSSAAWFSFHKTGQPSAAVSLAQIMDDVISGGGNNIRILSITGNPLTSLNNTGIAADIEKKVSYKITGAKKESDSLYSANMTINAPDIQSIFESAGDADISADGSMQSYLEKQLQGSPAMKTSQVTVQLVNQNGDWYLEPNSDWSDAMTGGLFSYYAQVVSSMENSTGN